MHCPIPSVSAVPTVRSFSAVFDPLSLIRQFPDCYPGLLESSAELGSHAAGGRFDILPISTGEVLKLEANGRLTGRDADDAGFCVALGRWWQALRLPASGSRLPFSGGWLVYLSYELAAEIEPQLALPQSAEPLIALAVRCPAAWIRDRSSGLSWLVAEADAEHLLDRFERHLGLTTAPAHPVAAFSIVEDDPGHFLAAVSRILDYIAAGDVYQVNLSRQWRVVPASSVEPTAIYHRLRRANPSPFAVFMQHEGFALMSSSPERLLSLRNGRISTRPIAGTRPRGATPELDAAMVQSLLHNDKERAEHVMLIDLERNDLGRVCRGGTVDVDEYMCVETYAHVHHIVSNVCGELHADVSPVEAMRALFPGGTITGCPKFRCMQIIAELEGVGRGAYTGSVGYLNRDGSCDFNILIRTLSAQRASAQTQAALTFRTGAGIVADSVPVQELEETRAKALGLLRALGSAS